MIINFRLDDYYEMCDEYEEIFEQEETFDIIDGDNCLVVRSRRIVIPALHASFREAEWLAKDPDTEGENDTWEIQSSVIVHYDENEKDPAKFVSYATCSMTNFAGEFCNALGINSCDVPQLECYIDTSEFIAR